MFNTAVNTHLSKEEIVKSGSVFTPPELINLIYQKINPFVTDKSVIGDFGSGYGSFLDVFQNKGKRCFATEIDDYSYNVLKLRFSNIDIYHENSLLNINREKYNIDATDDLIVVGNPPFNDTTSVYKKGEKGKLVCDDDILSRDFGISFLRAYNKLNAKYVCVLHPLAYLIKKTNFNSLCEFKNNYELIDATIFSSKMFEGNKKTAADFPVVAALYKKSKNGMDYDYVYNFDFKIYKSEKLFRLNSIKTIDGTVSKYPKKDSTSGLQYYTLRDMNALMRNAGFVENRTSNAVAVTDDTLYQYCWLLFLKENFAPKNNKYIYGNLSPLYSDKLNDSIFRNTVISYAYNHNKLIKKYYSKEKIQTLYGPIKSSYNVLYEELNNLYDLFN